MGFGRDGKSSSAAERKVAALRSVLVKRLGPVTVDMNTVDDRADT